MLRLAALKAPGAPVKRLLATLRPPRGELSLACLNMDQAPLPLFAINPRWRGLKKKRFCSPIVSSPCVLTTQGSFDAAPVVRGSELHCARVCVCGCRVPFITSDLIVSPAVGRGTLRMTDG